jgi:hypothetical protein
MLGQTGDILCLWSWNDPFRRRTMPRPIVQSPWLAKRFTGIFATPDGSDG